MSTDTDNAIKYPTDLKPGYYSEPQVMKSAAGYYVGTFYMEPLSEFYPSSGPFLVPGSRDSGYFGSYAEAQAYLETFNV